MSAVNVEIDTYCVGAVVFKSVLILLPSCNVVAPRVQWVPFTSYHKGCHEKLHPGIVQVWLVVFINPTKALTPSVFLESCIEIERGWNSHVDALAHRMFP